MKSCFKKVRTSILLLGASILLMACQVGSCTDTAVLMTNPADMNDVVWCDVRVRPCTEWRTETRTVTNAKGEVREIDIVVCDSPNSKLLGCDTEDTGCKVCFDAEANGQEVTQLDVCVQFCRDHVDLSGGLDIPACEDVTVVDNTNVELQALLEGEEQLCANLPAADQPDFSPASLHRLQAVRYPMNVDLGSSVSIDIADGAAKGAANARYGSISVVEEDGIYYLTDLIMAVTDIEIEGEELKNGRLELLEPVEIDSGEFTVPSGTKVAIVGNDKDGVFQSSIYWVKTPLDGFFSPNNDFFEISGNLASSTENATIKISLNIRGDVRDRDGDGIGDGRDNCPYVANPSQQDSSGSGYGDTCASNRVLSMDLVSDWSAQATPLFATDGVGGGKGILVSGTGYVPIQSVPLATAQLTQGLGDISGPMYLEVGVRVPSDQPNPYWVGALQAYIEVPSAGIYNFYVGEVELTDFPVGYYWPASFDLPQSIVTMLAGTHEDVRIKFALNVNQGAELFALDNIAIGKGAPVPLAVESAFTCPPARMGEPSGCAAGRVLNFEGDDWSTPHGTILRISEANSGFSALQFTGGGYAVISSRELGTAEMLEILPAGGPATLLLDVMPSGDQPNPYWLGAVQILLNVPDQEVHNAFVGHVELTGLATGTYNSISLSVSESLLSTLRELPYFDASFQIVINVPEDAPPIVIDNLRFAN